MVQIDFSAPFAERAAVGSLMHRVVNGDFRDWGLILSELTDGCTVGGPASLAVCSFKCAGVCLDGEMPISQFETGL
jgi:hypothetical protein